jgi:hypothetical protein
MREEDMVTPKSVAATVLAALLQAIPSAAAPQQQLSSQQVASKPALSGILRVRVVGGVPREDVRAHLKGALPGLRTDGGEDDFVLMIKTLYASSKGHPTISSTDYYQTRVTVYRKIIVGGREGKFVIFEDLQPWPRPRPVAGRASRMAELGLREFIRAWKAANGDGRTLDVPGKDAGVGKTETCFCGKSEKCDKVYRATLAIGEKAPRFAGMQFIWQLCLNQNGTFAWTSEVPMAVSADDGHELVNKVRSQVRGKWSRRGDKVLLRREFVEGPVGSTGIKAFLFRNGQQEVSVDDRQAVIQQGADKCVLKRIADAREPNPLPVPGSPSLAPGQLKAQEALLTQLKANLSKARVTMQDRHVDLVVEWVTHSRARNCQRPLDLNLADNRLGAFLHPIQKPSTPDISSTQDVAADPGKLMQTYLDSLASEFAEQVRTYLQTTDVRESRVQAGDNVDVEGYLKRGVGQ